MYVYMCGCGRGKIHKTQSLGKYKTVNTFGKK